MAGHIKLGLTPTSLVDFLLVDPTSRVRSRFNPLAPKIGQGAVQFNDYTSHEYWEISNWAKGIGNHADAGVEGGYLYGEVDSRAGNSFILPPLLTVRTSESNVDTSPTTNNIGNGLFQTIDDGTYAAIQFFMDAAGDIYIYMDSQGSVTAKIYSDVAGEPGAELWSGFVISDSPTISPGWARVDNTLTPVLTTPYWLILFGNSSSFDLYCMPVASTGGEVLSSTDLSTWTAIEVEGQPAYSPYVAGVGGLGTIVAAQTVGASLFTLADDGNVYKYNTSTETFDAFADTAETSTDMQLWFGELIVTHGDAANMDAVNATTAAVVGLAENGDFLVVWNGYLWRSHHNIVSYSSDGVTWSSDIVCGPDDYDINGMTGLGDDLIVSTAQAIWRVAPGDWVFGVTKWAYQSDGNGPKMINNQGVAYIPAENSLIRMQINAPLMDIWARDEGLPSGIAGKISGVIGTNKEVIVYVDPADSGGISTCWSFNNQGWHYVASLPQGQSITTMHYDSSQDSIWLFSDTGHAWSFYASSTASSPLTDSLTTFTPAGMVDTGDFHGGLRTLVKDFDGVTVVGDSISDTRGVDIYWRIPGGGELDFVYENDGEILYQADGEALEVVSSGWSYLGQVTESGQTLRWTDYTVRPISVSIQLAYVIHTNNVTISPRIHGVVVKYHSHIVDQFRWQLPLVAHDRQETLDWKRDSRTYAEILSALESTEIDRYLPIWFSDVDGRTYEVKVIGFAERLIKYEAIPGADPSLQSVIDLTLQEVAPYSDA